MIAFQAKSAKLSGTNYSEIKKQAKNYLAKLQGSSKRKPFIRSAYFKKEKVFLDNFWPHIFQKSPKERFSRLKMLPLAVELIQNSKNKPEATKSRHKNETFYRFAGISKQGELFFVQIKENNRTKRKYLMSVFLPKY